MKKMICMILTVLLLLCVLPGQVQASGPVCTTVSEATEMLRQAMVARESTVEIQCALPKSVFDGSEQQASALSQEVLTQAESHTGVSVEGDYLKWNRGSVSTGCSWTISGDDIVLTLTYDVEYYTTAQQEQQVTDAVGEALDSLDLDQCSDYEKICRIYKYIADHVAYDYEHLNDDSYTRKHSTYAAMIDGSAVCQGYATLLYRMLLEEGIDCRVITGIGNGGDHAWNIAKLDGAYYLLDVTWDETSTPEYYWYFLKGSDAFGDHTPESAYTTEEFQAQYPVSAEDYTLPADGKEFTEGDFTYTVSNGYATITKYTGLEENVVIPARIGGYPVIAVGHEAIEYNDTMKTLTISEGIESIFMGNSTSFVFCSALEEIHLPESLVVNISYDKGGGSGTFGFFNECDQVKSIHVPQTNPYIVEVEGVIYSKNMSAILCYPPAKAEETYIAPDTVRSIADSAFYRQAYLKEVILPDEITYIGYWAFCGAEQLERINIPAQCKNIGQFAFVTTNLKSIHIPAALNPPLWNLVDGTPLETVTVDPGNPYFKAIDNVLYRINEDGIPYCLVFYPSGIERESFTIPDSVTEIQSGAFKYSKLKELILSSNLTELPSQTLFDCHNLQRLVIPTSLQTIEDCWGNNRQLKEVFYLGTKQQWDNMNVVMPSKWDNVLFHYGVTDPETHSTATGETVAPT